jgi:hypothetical protein
VICFGECLNQTVPQYVEIYARWKAGLIMAQGQLAFWQSQSGEVPQLNVLLWTKAVASDERLVATAEARITQLLAQIAGAQ